ncbi:uncharacterized protein EAE98_008341 [Botrytis deweyae]|uniref:Uncharacterized protein n=1 Tax=Botrytis deweyae TaxID=2478750 RepID=A0ABQ7IF36_9HELO|nr:uncharacterized protein EAE98_008341 [Botrytis deweyae]KAF7922130.1 hypothetical protein EAE98_008341 [Botrytis deweyae]
MSINARRSAPSARSSLREREFNSASIAGEHSKNFTTEKKFVIGVDFGTTFTSVSYFFHPINERHPRAFPEQILSIKNWPEDLSSGDAGGTRPQVPSETWYSPIPLSREAPQDTDEHDETLEEFVYDDEDHPLTYVRDANAESDGDESSEFLWGYQVHHQQYRENISRNTGTRVKRSKLHLVPTAYTHDDRIELLRSIEILIDNGIIRKHGSKNEPDARDVLDIFTDFLLKVLNHTKEQLIQLHNFSSQSVVEFALTVPTIWSPNASRILQTALQNAARLVKFGNISPKKAVVPYIVSEPEAAAIYMLAGNSSVHPRETFIIADCGGGTVDIVTYEIGTEHPLRLSEEKVTPGGDNCGSSYLNENWKNMLLNKLKDESYLLDMWPAGESLESIVNRFIPNFENDHKRRKDITSVFGLKTRLHLPGLKANAEKRFDDGHIVIIKQDWEEVFNPLLERVKKLLHTQLLTALEKDLKVKKVFLLGGFGASPSLRSYLRNYLREMSNKPEVGYDIKLMTGNDASGYPVTAVSCGAVLAALNKTNGPARRAQSSYGFFSREPYEKNPPLGYPGHVESTFIRDREICPIDGDEYVHVINYFVIKGELVPPKYKFPPITSIYTFPLNEEKFICEELLYVSDKARLSHFPLAHDRNNDAQIASRIIFDMTFLRTKKLIKPTTVRRGPISIVKPHYQFQLEIFPELNGMLLEYYAKYSTENGKTTVSKGQVSVAAAFAPGCE